MPAERIVRSGMYSLAGSSIAALAALALTVFVGHGLGAYGTGLFFQAVGIFTIATQVLRLGTNSSIVKMIAEQRAFSRHGESWRTVLIAVVPVTVIAIASGAAVWALAGPLARWLASEGTGRDLESLLRFMAPFIVIGAMLGVLQIAARMMRGIASFTLVQSILLPITRLVAVGAVILTSGDMFSAFAAWLAVGPVWLILTIVIITRPLIADWLRRNEAHESLPHAAGRFWSFGAWRSVGAALEVLLEWSDVLLVAALTTPVEAGIYAVATRAVRAGQVVDRAVRLAVSPRISELLAKSELGAARTLHTSVTRAMILTNWPFYMTLAVLGPAVLGVFGPEFTDGGTVLAIMAVTMLVSSGAGMLQSILLQGGRSSWQVMNKTIALAVSIGMNLALVPLLGILGAAITWAAMILTDTSLAAFQVHRRMGVQLQPLLLVPAMLLPVLVFGGGGLALRMLLGPTRLTLVIAFFTLTPIYLALLWLLRRPLQIEKIWNEFGRFVPRRKLRTSVVSQQAGTLAGEARDPSP
jgi:O-antigen/teichoic acid export membrane protein